MESERRILPLPRRRVTSGSNIPPPPEAPQTSVSPGVLFSRLHTLNDEVNLLSQSLGPPANQFSSDLSSSVSGVQSDSPHGDHLDLDESEDDDEDDECTGCRDWLENVKNKKKRKIPTSAVMGHTNTVSSPVQHVYGTTISPSRGTKAKTRRRRTWDVSSEARPDTSFRGARDANTSAVFPDVPQWKGGLISKDFDFTCDSPVSRNLPAPLPAPVEILPSEPISVATQTSPTLAAMEPILPPRHRRTKEEKAYDRQRLVAKQRREARAKLKPGEKETIWICQFCEFESIFGYAPLALINGYTERVRTARRAALERKRLLEKARSKGKKKKKAQNKTSNHSAAPPPMPDANVAPAVLQNGAKTGIDKAIGPGSSSCTCCDHRRDKEDRDRRHRLASTQRPAPPAPSSASHSHHHHHHTINHNHHHHHRSRSHVDSDEEASVVTANDAILATLT